MKTCMTCKYHSLLDMDGKPDEKFGFSYCEKGIRDASKTFCCNKHEKIKPKDKRVKNENT